MLVSCHEKVEGGLPEEVDASVLLVKRGSGLASAVGCLGLLVSTVAAVGIALLVSSKASLGSGNSDLDMRHSLCNSSTDGELCKMGENCHLVTFVLGGGNNTTSLTMSLSL